MIVTAHQPTYLPGVSVMAKVAKADAVVWLDAVRFTTPGYMNRNRLPDGTWLVVPVDRRDHRSLIREVTLGAGDWCSDHCWTLRNRYMNAGHFDPGLLDAYDGDLAKPGASLATFNCELLEWIIGALGLPTRQFMQSDLEQGPGTLSSKIASMVKSIGGTAYLSGPTSKLDRDTFESAGIELLFYRYAGENPTVIDPLFTAGELPTNSKEAVIAGAEQ